jgi:hypothetical protein
MIWNAPLLIFVGWILYGIVNALYGNLAPQLSESCIRNLAILDLFAKLSIYSSAAWLLFGYTEPSHRHGTWRCVLCCVASMLLLECLIRWYGAAASMGGELWYRIPRALGLGVKGFAVIPLIGFSYGMGLSRLFRKREV